MFARERKSTFRTKTMIGENEHREERIQERKTKTKKDRRKTIQEETRKRQQQKRRKNHNQDKKTEETKTDPKTKTISIKKKPRASCTRLRQFRRKRRNCRYKSSSGGVWGRYRDKLRRNDVTKTWKATMSGRFARSVESRSMNDTGRSKEIRRKGIIMSSTANVGTVTLVC